MLRYACVSFVILGSFLVAAGLQEEKQKLHDYWSEAFKSCSKEFGISLEDVEATKENKSDIDPCFIKCILKSNKLIDDKGMFDPKQGMEIAEMFITNPDELAKIKKVSDTCQSVNDEKVSDGEKGCERSVLLMQCLMENKSQLL
uniref:Odorant binding protein n=1 Tax=Semiothisa cinerearia TaxID=2249628 RepID=A0A889XL57_9NEOP|nr:odorant binding protein [Semiothisa cinerearia]